MNLSVKFAGTGQAGTELDGLEASLALYWRNIKEIQSRLRPAVGTQDNISRALGTIAEEVEQEKKAVRILREVLRQAEDNYRTCESRLAETHLQETRMEVAADNANLFEWADAWSIAGELGIAGSLIGITGTWVTGDDPVKNLLSSAEFINKAIGAGAEAVKDGNTTAAWGKQIFGLNNALKELDVSSAGKTFGSSMSSQWDDLFAPEIATTADKVKLGTKWFGNVLTLAGNAYENYNEMQEDGITAGRAVAETVIETGVDIGMGMAATAAVSAAAVALGVTAAPALAIGAAAVGVTWAVNSVCEWATGGKDVGEVVADAVCDLGEGAVKLGKNIASAAGDVAKAAADAVKDGASAIWSGICGIFG